MQKQRTMVFETFLTAQDGKTISAILKNNFDKIDFIDRYPWPAPEPVICQSIDMCHGAINSGCVIINQNIISLEHYKKIIYKIPTHEIYHGPMVGEGLIQVEHSRVAEYQPGGLRNGRFAASFYIDDLQTKKFAQDIFKIVKKYLIKVEPLDISTGEVVPVKLARGFYAGPDAIEKYDQVNGLFLTNHAQAYFTSRTHGDC